MHVQKLGEFGNRVNRKKARNGDRRGAWKEKKFLKTLNRRIGHLLAPSLLMVIFAKFELNEPTQLLSQLEYIKTLLSQIGPALSAVLLIIAGIFYANTRL